MLLITIEPRAVDCRVELDGIDISRRIRRLELDASVDAGLTVIRLTLLDGVTVVGEVGRFEFIQGEQTDGTT